MARGRKKKVVAEQSQDIVDFSEVKDEALPEIVEAEPVVSVASEGVVKASFRGAGFHLMRKSNGQFRAFSFGLKNNYLETAVGAEEIAWCETRFERA